MCRQQKIEQEVEKTLQCFDQIDRVEPNPWFLTRLWARIQSLEEQRERPVPPLFTLIILRPAVLVLIVVLNLVTMFVVLQRESASIQNRDLLNSFATEYAYTSTDEFLSLDSM